MFEEMIKEFVIFMGVNIQYFKGRNMASYQPNETSEDKYKLEDTNQIKESETMRKTFRKCFTELHIKLIQSYSVIIKV